MRVLFYEPAFAGHHFAYFARMLPAFLELPIEIGLVTQQKAIESDEYAKFLACFSDRIELIPDCRDMSSCKPVTKGWRRAQDLKQAIDQWKPDHVCVLYADGIWPWLTAAKLFGYDFLKNAPSREAWMYRGKFGYSDSTNLGDKVRRWLYKKMLKSNVFDKIHFDDDLMFKFHNSLGIDATEVVLPPNPVLIREPLTQQESRQRFELPSEGRLISLSGMISSFKGADLALQAFEQIAQEIPDTKLLLAGPHEQRIRDFVKQPRFAKLQSQGRILCKDRYLNEEEMLLTAEASDLVLAPYPNHSGRSSIILWAAAAGTPVLAVGKGCIGHVVRTEHLGQTCGVQNIEEFCATLKSSLSTPWTEEDIQRVRTYAKMHSIENYQQSSSALVRSLCEANDEL